jgi:hypothetical protein
VRNHPDDEPAARCIGEGEERLKQRLGLGRLAVGQGEEALDHVTGRRSNRKGTELAQRQAAYCANNSGPRSGRRTPSMANGMPSTAHSKPSAPAQRVLQQRQPAFQLLRGGPRHAAAQVKLHAGHHPDSFPRLRRAGPAARPVAVPFPAANRPGDHFQAAGSIFCSSAAPRPGGGVSVGGGAGRVTRKLSHAPGDHRQPRTSAGTAHDDECQP